MKFKEFWVSMLTDAEGSGISIKRFIGLITFILFSAFACIDTFTAKRPADIFIDGMMYIILGAFFAGTLEYFSKRQPISTTTTVKNNEQVIVQVPDSSSTTTTTTIASVVENEDFIVDNNTE